MKFYEAKFMCPPGTNGEYLDDAAREVAAMVQGRLEVHSTTIHARPSNDFPTRHDCAIFVSSPNRRELFEFAGKMSRLHGMAMTNFVKIGEGQDTLNFKAIEGSDELEEDAARGALGADETFSITDIKDKADE